MSTASNAREAIAAAEAASDATPSGSASSNAHEYPDIAAEEMDQLSADDRDNVTRRIAAAMTTFHDQRPFVSTKQGMVRRQFDDDGNATRRTAREMVDMFAAYGDAKPTETDKANKRAMQAHDFAADVNRSAMENTLPAGGNVFERGSDEWRQSGDGVIDAIVRRSEVLKK
jgi:hypothetical protein